MTAMRLPTRLFSELWLKFLRVHLLHPLCYQVHLPNHPTLLLHGSPSPLGWWVPQKSFNGTTSKKTWPSHSESWERTERSQMSPWPVKMVTRLKLTKSFWRHSVHSSWSSWRRINTPILLYTWGASCQRILWLLWTFVYNGEATVFQDSLDAFLALAEELKLKGLSGSAEA